MTFEAAECEYGKFIFSMVEYTWVRDINRDKTYNTLVTAGQIITHLQAICVVIYALDVLALQNKTQLYHIDREGIMEYINELEDDQAMTEQANNPITNTTPAIIATNAILSKEKLPQANK